MYPLFLLNKGTAMDEKRKAKILVVDDNKSFCDLVKAAFEENFILEFADNSNNGLAKAEEFAPDLILLDINLPPGPNGIEFLRKMALKTEICSIPVIAITAINYDGITESLVKKEPNVRAFMTKLSPLSVIEEKIVLILKGVA